MRSTLFVRISVVGFTLFMVMPALALAAPQPPANPTSTSDCNQYSEEYWQWSKQMGEEIRQCNEQHKNDPIKFVYVRCSPIDWNVYCAKLHEENDCEEKNYYEQMRICRAKVSAVRDSSKEDVSDVARRHLLGGTPDLLKLPSSKLEDYYSDLQEGLTAIAPATSPHQKIGASGRLMSHNLLGDELSSKLTDFAITGVVNTNEAILKKLEQELDKISSDVGALYKRQIAQYAANFRASAEALISERNKREAEEAIQPQPSYEPPPEPEPAYEPSDEVSDDPNAWIVEAYTEQGVRTIQGCVMRARGCNACEPGPPIDSITGARHFDCDDPSGLREAIEICTPVCGLDHLRR